MRGIINFELQALQEENPEMSESDVFDYMGSFSNGVWSAFREINDLMIKENVTYNKRLVMNPDHW